MATEFDALRISPIRRVCRSPNVGSSRRCLRASVEGAARPCLHWRLMRLRMSIGAVGRLVGAASKTPPAPPAPPLEQLACELGGWRNRVNYIK